MHYASVSDLGFQPLPALDTVAPFPTHHAPRITHHILLGAYFADLLVEQKLIVELKAVREIADEHVAQILGYLRSARVETGLLINFGAPKLYVKKYLMTDQVPPRGFLASILALFLQR